MFKNSKIGHTSAPFGSYHNVICMKFDSIGYSGSIIIYWDGLAGQRLLSHSPNYFDFGSSSTSTFPEIASAENYWLHIGKTDQMNEESLKSYMWHDKNTAWQTPFG